jgi:uncharacterized linocin/CFP29 family protein
MAVIPMAGAATIKSLPAPAVKSAATQEESTVVETVDDTAITGAAAMDNAPVETEAVQEPKTQAEQIADGVSDLKTAVGAGIMILVIMGIAIALFIKKQRSF